MAAVSQVGQTQVGGDSEIMFLCCTVSHVLFPCRVSGPVPVLSLMSCSRRSRAVLSLMSHVLCPSFSCYTVSHVLCPSFSCCTVSHVLCPSFSCCTVPHVSCPLSVVLMLHCPSCPIPLAMFNVGQPRSVTISESCSRAAQPLMSRSRAMFNVGQPRSVTISVMSLYSLPWS